MENLTTAQKDNKGRGPTEWKREDSRSLDSFSYLLIAAPAPCPSLCRILGSLIAPLSPPNHHGVLFNRVRAELARNTRGAAVRLLER